MCESQAFFDLLKGNPNAHYTRDADGGYLAVERGIELSDVERHLSGIHPSLLSIPIDADGNSHFAFLDVDRHEETDIAVDYVAVAKLVTALELPLIIFKSKNGKGAWIGLFIKEKLGYPAPNIRRLLEVYKVQVGSSGPCGTFP
jgi:hypothetical protein